MKRILKKTIITIFIGLGAVVLTLQIPKVNSWLVQGLFNFVLPSSHRVVVDSIRGAFPFEITIKKVTFYDRQGRWLRLKDVHYSWRGVDLFFKKINFDQVTIDKINIYRTPEGSNSAFHLNSHFPKVNINEFKINDLSVLDRAQVSVTAQLKTPKSNHHYLTAQICMPNGQDKIVEISGSLIREQMSVTVSLENSMSDIIELFPQIRNQVQGGHVTSELEFYSDRQFQEISCYFRGHVSHLKSTQPFIHEVIGEELEWAMNTNLKPQEDAYRLVGKMTSSGGIHNTWDVSWKPLIDEFKAQLDINLPKIHQLHVLPDDYDGDINITARIENKVIKWQFSGLRYLKRVLPPSEGEVTIHHVRPHVDLNFTAQLYMPGISPHLSGHWYRDANGWHIENGQIHDPNIDFRYNVHSGADLAGSLEGCIKDLSVLNTLTNLNLVGKSQLTCQINKNQGNYESQWSYGELAGSIIGAITLTSEQKINKIHVQDLSLYKKDACILKLKKPWDIQLDTQGFTSSLASFNLGDGHLEVKNGQVRDSSIAGNILLSNISIKTLHHLGIDGEYEGMIHGEVKFTGTKDKPEFKSCLKLEKISLLDEDRKRSKFFNINLQLERHQEKYHLNLGYQDSTNAELSAKGYLLSQHFIPKQSDSLDVSISGAYNLSILNIFLNRSDRLKGIAHVSAKVKGALASPHMTGKLNLNNGTYENSEFGLLIQNISFVGHLHNNEVTIDRFEGYDVDRGTAHGSGYIKFTSFVKPQMNFDVSLNNLIIANSDLLLLRAGGNLKINQLKNSPLTVSGKLTVNSADAFLADTAPKTKLIQIRNKKELQGSALPKKLLDNKVPKDKVGQLKINVDIPQRLFIRGYGVASQWKGTMMIEGALNDAQISGNLSLIQGQVEVAGKVLPLIEGNIKFIPSKDEIDPLLHIIAGKTINDTKAMIKIEGPSSRPETSFLSVPILPQEEIVSLILFSKPLNSVTAAQSLRLATAIASIKSSGNRGRSITERLRTDFGLDEIGFQSEDNGEDSGDLTSGYSLHVGKQLTDRAYIALKQGLKRETGTDVILRYDLTEHAKAEFEAGTGRHANTGGLSWEKRY